jgi:hypothetical protein
MRLDEPPGALLSLHSLRKYTHHQLNKGGQSDE